MPTTFAEKMAFLYLVAIVIALPFFGLVLITIDRGKIGQAALGILDVVTNVEQRILNHVWNSLWPRC